MNNYSISSVAFSFSVLQHSVGVYLQVEVLGVLSGVLVRARSHWSSNSSNSSSVGPPSAVKQPIRTNITD